MADLLWAVIKWGIEMTFALYYGSKIVGLYPTRDEAQEKIDTALPLQDEQDRCRLRIVELEEDQLRLCGKYTMIQHENKKIELMFFAGFLPQGKRWKALAGRVYSHASYHRTISYPRFTQVRAYSYLEAEMLAIEKFSEHDRQIAIKNGVR